MHPSAAQLQGPQCRHAHGAGPSAHDQLQGECLLLPCPGWNDVRSIAAAMLSVVKLPLPLLPTALLRRITGWSQMCHLRSCDETVHVVMLHARSSEAMATAALSSFPFPCTQHLTPHLFPFPTRRAPQ